MTLVEATLRPRQGRVKPVVEMCSRRHDRVGCRPTDTMSASTPPTPRLRLSDLGLSIGRLPAGPTNSINDVPDVSSGHATVWRDEPAPPVGRGIARTGVTAIIPFDAATLFDHRVAAAVSVLNGAGEMTGSLAIAEWGVLETPIFLTSTMAVGRVFDGAVTELVARVPRIGRDDAVIPVVGECDDGLLNDSRTVQVDTDDVARALADAAGRGPRCIPEGVVGAGTGMVAFELKGGIGSSSRVAGPWTVGVLVLANFGRLDRLTVDGVPVGVELVRSGWAAEHIEQRATHDQGSCIGVVATDAPLAPDQLRRLARRAGLGLARTGSYAGHYSGEIFVAFSTGTRLPRSAETCVIATTRAAEAALDGLFEATVDATEEAVLNALCAADTVVGLDGRSVPGLPIRLVVDILSAHGVPASMP
jgi:D-aminopeptidase